MSLSLRAHSKASWRLVGLMDLTASPSGPLILLMNVFRQVSVKNFLFVLINIDSYSLVSVSLKKVVLISQIFSNKV